MSFWWSINRGGLYLSLFSLVCPSSLWRKDSTKYLQQNLTLLIVLKARGVSCGHAWDLCQIDVFLIKNFHRNEIFAWNSNIYSFKNTLEKSEIFNNNEPRFLPIFNFNINHKQLNSRCELWNSWLQIISHHLPVKRLAVLFFWAPVPFCGLSSYLGLNCLCINKKLSFQSCLVTSAIIKNLTADTN